MTPWWQDAVIYQIYPRSFCDSDSDGVGDLPGILGRLDHLVDLGVDALWLSPIYPSPLADFGYDVSDLTAVDPVYGSLADFDRLVAEAHGRGLRVLLDFVPCHTSIEHPWFAEHPDWYIWAEGRGEEPPNNWRAAFGGRAWSRDPAGGPRWYMHSFYAEQPQLNWRHPDLVTAMQDALRFWLERGVDGFRLDALDHLIKDSELRDDPPLREPFPLPLHEGAGMFERRYSVDRPEVLEALAAIRAAVGDALLVGEVYLPAARAARYLEHLDAAFAFEFFQAPWDAGAMRAAIEAAPGPAWALSNHDFPRLATRFGERNLRAAAVLQCTLAGPVFLYQGDEIGLRDGPGHDPPYDRAGRDRSRHPMQWDSSPTGGFTMGDAWLAPVDPEQRNVADQAADPDSLLSFYRGLIALRRELSGDVRMLEAEPGVIAFERGEHRIAVNTAAEPRSAPWGESIAGGNGVVRAPSG